MAKGQKVYVGMSGGVDSSVSAALLQQEGYDVTGVFIKVWQADFLPCTWREERRDAMRAASSLGIPLITLDLEREYKQEVVDYMIKEYQQGRVPNPDIMCNKHVKFGAFYEFAMNKGADFIATGHYAQVKTIDGYSYLACAGDTEKDQTYFLWSIDQQVLSRTLFPVGHLKKSEVRILAERFNLPNAQKKDSQGLCFIGKVDMRDFLKHYLNTTEGEVLDVTGKVIGSHEGAILYTIGQRHGFSVLNHTEHSAPLYVITKDIQNNTITVADKTNEHNASAKSFRSGNILMNKSLNISSGQIQARLRHRGEMHWGTIEIQNSHTLKFTLSDPCVGVSVGQSAVFYKDEMVLGGAVIDSIEYT